MIDAIRARLVSGTSDQEKDVKNATVIPLDQKVPLVTSRQVNACVNQVSEEEDATNVHLVSIDSRLVAVLRADAM